MELNYLRIYRWVEPEHTCYELCGMRDPTLMCGVSHACHRYKLHYATTANIDVCLPAEPPCAVLGNTNDRELALRTSVPD